MKKRFVALLVLLAAMCWTVGAMAVIAPATVADLSDGAAVPTSAPIFDINEVDDHYELVINWDIPVSNWDEIMIHGESGEEITATNVSYDKSKGAYVVSDIPFEISTVFLDGEDAETGNYYNVSHYCSIDIGHIDYSSIVDDNLLYLMKASYGDGSINEYTCTLFQDDVQVDIIYDRDGIASDYRGWWRDSNDNLTSITRSVDGTVREVRYDTYLDGFSWQTHYFWHWDTNQWIDDDGNIGEGIPPFNPDNFPLDVEFVTLERDPQPTPTSTAAPDTTVSPESSAAPTATPEPTATPVPTPTPTPAPYNWYPNNSVGVLGLSLRDDLGLSDKWYNVVPVDLTVEGRQAVRLVASNMYYFGYATIDVAGGNVTVNYQLPGGHTYLKSECLQWFTSLDDISSSFLNDPVGEYAFGEPVSISEALNGQDVALLFICNRVTYRQPITNQGGRLVRYYDGNPEWVAWRAHLNSLLDSME